MGKREDASARANAAMDRGERASYDDLMECDMDTVRRAQIMERAKFPALAAIADSHRPTNAHDVADTVDAIDRDAANLAPDEYAQMQDEYRRIGWSK